MKNDSDSVKSKVGAWKSRCLILRARSLGVSQVPDLAELAILFLFEARQVALAFLVVKGVALNRQLVHDVVYLLLLLLEETEPGGQSSGRLPTVVRLGLIEVSGAVCHHVRRCHLGLERLLVYHAVRIYLGHGFEHLSPHGCIAPPAQREGSRDRLRGQLNRFCQSVC